MSRKVLLLIFYLLLFVLSRAMKKKKANNQNAARPAQAPKAPPAEAQTGKALIHPASSVRTAAKAPVVSAKPAPKPEKVKKTQPVAAQPTLNEGESFKDSRGDYAGSLGEHTNEGESTQEHALHMQNSAPLPGKERARARLTAGNMRRAVLYRELLAPPPGLRDDWPAV